MENVRDIAKWFLSHQSMTHKKVQKLCYYAQAWYCALYDGSPLFEDEIQAWVHGPVIPALYPVYADYRWENIPKQNFDESNLSDKALDILEAVYNTYGGFTGDQLERLTHSEKPWQQARGNLKPWEASTVPISCSSMREYYARAYEQAQND
ncbi:MAG: DUF4065 domain-containing protein [Clostridiales bacterium]|nr:DUF4065 domain-containing protein [Bacteroidales bacterium]MCC8098622.1 DUF4065 domain-containing protein [Clostridiales bacterium]